MMPRLAFATALVLLASSTRADDGPKGRPATPVSATHFPLAKIADVPLPGGATRFDYQEIDSPRGHLVVAHMNDASVLVLKLADGSVAKELHGIPTPRGVAVGEDDARIFVTSSPATLVIIDAKSLNELARVPTGRGPDGVAYDPIDHIVATSDQRDGAVSLIAGSGEGKRRQVALGRETGNVAFDPARRVFWIAVETSTPPDQLVSIDPKTGDVRSRIGLPGCKAAHGVRLHPDGSRAFVACEDNDRVVAVDLEGARSTTFEPTGSGPDVLSIDPGLGYLYIAAESGELTVLDITRRELTVLDREHVGANAHSVAVEPATHRVFFPLAVGPSGRPALRILRPQHSP
jgi:YVTN family beta-propeller protein